MHWRAELTFVHNPNTYFSQAIYLSACESGIFKWCEYNIVFFWCRAVTLISDVPEGGGEEGDEWKTGTANKTVSNN